MSLRKEEDWQCVNMRTAIFQSWRMPSFQSLSYSTRTPAG